MKNLPSEPRLKTVDVLRWLWRQKPESFVSSDLMNKYNLTRGEANRRLSYLRLWGCVRRIGKAPSHRRGHPEIVYRVTRWGGQYAEAKGRIRSGAD